MKPRQPNGGGAASQQGSVATGIDAELARLHRTQGDIIPSLQSIRTKWKYLRHKFTPRSYAELICAYARIFSRWSGAIPPRWLPMLYESIQAVDGKVGQLPTEMIVRLAAALMFLDLRDRAPLSQIFNYASEQIWKMSREEQLLLLEYSAHLPYPRRRETFDSLAAQQLIRSAPFIRKRGHNAAVSAWLLSINNPAAAHTFLSQVGNLDELPFRPGELRQLYQASLACGFRLPRALLAEVEMLFDEMRREPPIVNGFESSVAGEAAALWPTAKVIHQFFIEGYFIDILLELEGGIKLAIECDGVNFHEIELLGTSLHMWGPTLLKHQLLRRNGHRVLHILDTEWNALDRVGRLTLLSTRAAEALKQ